MADNGDDIVLRPLLKPLGGLGAGGNPFASFGKGAGFGIKAKKASTTVSTADDTTTKKDSERIKYSKEFLMQFMERYVKCPTEVQQLGMPEIVISEESERDQQRQLLQKVAEDIDDRDWRTKDAAPVSAPAKPAASDAKWESGKEQLAAQPKAQPAATTAPAQPQQAAAPAQKQTDADQPAPKIVRAEEKGLQAYKPGTQLSPEERALRTIKGILNKLTPEKFERLLQQLLEVITTADILRSTITLVFENAVEQPTYCAMYADLCLRLSKELPSFPGPTPNDKPITFLQILLNTCQDEFEGTENAREALAKMDPAEREESERAVKKRTMGNMRLISELYKQEMVKDWIMTTCMETLLSAPKGKVPPEDNLEAACEMITTAGRQLSKSERADTRRKLDSVMATLEKLAADKGVASRIRFIIKDVLDLKRSNWVPRREVFTAKKLDEVRAQAEAELGMISSTIAAALPTLPAQQRLGGGLVDDIPLIPPLRSNGAEAADGWMGLFPPLRSQQGAGAPAGGSALLGDFNAPAKPAAAAAPQQPVNKPAGEESAGGEEELKRKSESLLQEYTSTLDKAEALQCVKELQAPGFMPRLVEVALEMILNSTKDKERSALQELLLHLHQQGAVSSADIVAGLRTYTEQLEDLSMDFPKAAQQLGGFVGACVCSGAMELQGLPTLLEGDYDVFPKRDLAAAAFKAVAAGKGGDAGLAEACSAAGIKASAFLEGEDAEPVAEWLKAQGLTAVPL